MILMIKIRKTLALEKYTNNETYKTFYTEYEQVKEENQLKI